MDTSLSNVLRVYSGKPGCMCGCKGKYSEAGESDRSVKIIYNKVMKDPAHVIEGSGSFVYAYVDTPTRTLVVYFK